MLKRLFWLAAIFGVIIWKWPDIKRLITACIGDLPTPGRSRTAPSRTFAAEQTMYVTPFGGSYHRRDCLWVADGAETIPLDEARRRYKPCKRCKPPV